MTGFSFPPPPPPPPKAASSQQPELQQNAPRGGRGGRGGGRGNPRGRGGQTQRGGRQQQQQYSNQNQNYGPPQNSFQNQYSGHGNIQQSYGNNPAANPLQQNYGMPAGAYVNPAFQSHSQNAGGASYGQQSYQQQQYGQQQNIPHGQHSNPGYSPNGQKRTREQAFGGQGAQRPHPMKKPPSAPKVKAAPAVPSFGSPLPIPPKPSSQTSVNQAGGKKTKVSLFGLTSEGGVADVAAPAEDSEEEDVDEEASFAAHMASGPMTIEYNGDTVALNSAADLAEWVNERKRRFPTKARIEEKHAEVRMRMEERKRIREETMAAAARADPGSLLAKSLPAKRERPRDREERPKWAKGKGRVGVQAGTAIVVSDADINAPAVVQNEPMTQTEARRQLEAKMKEVEELQKQLAESEAKATATAAAPATKLPVPEDIAVTKVGDGQVPTTENETESTGPPASASAEALQALEAALDDPNDTTAAQASNEPLTTTDAHPEADAASSSSDSDSDSSSDSSDDDESAPEETTSRSTGPVKVPPPNSERRICNTFATTGDCRFGAKCKFRHVSSEQTRLARNESKGNAKERGGRNKDKAEEKGRKTLHQRMLEQEREKEERTALSAIKFLGEIGFFRMDDKAQE